MNIKKAQNGGYCYGVIRALKMLEKAIEDESIPKPIYLYGEIIHNLIVIKELESKGVICLKRDPSLFDKISGTIVFSAHGTSKKIMDLARSKNLTVIDATCLDVYKNHELIEQNQDKLILYIGTKNHPESDVALEYSNTILITKPDELLTIKQDAILLSQTTMGIIEIEKFIEVAVKKPNIKIAKMQCLATTKRQSELLSELDSDLIYVLGDKMSNNSNKLASLSPKAILISSYKDINISDLIGKNKIFITAAASCPNKLMDEAIDYIKQIDNKNKLQV